MKKIKELCEKYREIIVYIIVGVLTTVFCWVVAWIMEHFIFDATVAIENFLINSICWVAGVLFAYPLNRKWVFKSTNPHILKEFFGFAGSRVSTYFLDIFIMWLFVNVFPFTGLIRKLTLKMGMQLEQTQLDSLNFWVAKIFISSVLVMIANYVFSKLLIFKKDKNTDKKEEN
ncbi:MAG: GtrA family protein [Lachnospiraceae bacterium]|nr:GtrA family protein [Lachnospiraceae bacterium]